MEITLVKTNDKYIFQSYIKTLNDIELSDDEQIIIEGCKITYKFPDTILTKFVLDTLDNINVKFTNATLRPPYVNKSTAHSVEVYAYFQFSHRGTKYIPVKDVIQTKELTIHHCTVKPIAKTIHEKYIFN